MAIDLAGSSAVDKLRYYIRGQAPGLGQYLLQGLVTSLFGWVPGLPGLILRALAYRAIVHMDGPCAIERGTRIRCAANVRLGRGVVLDQGTYLHATAGGIEIGANTTIMHNAELHVFNFRNLPHAFIKIGRDTFVGESVVVRGQGGVTIGDSVLIGPMAKILAVEHRFTDVSRPVIEQGITARGISIETGAWIGAGAAVLDGTRVGMGAVVGANAVVTSNVPPHSVVVGAPARVVRWLKPCDELARVHAMPAAECAVPRSRPETVDSRGGGA
jgi:acetyltransferase-like isoleucine patch superfamily enzyme